VLGAKLAGGDLPSVLDSDLTTGWFLREDIEVNITSLNASQDLLELLLLALDLRRCYELRLLKREAGRPCQDHHGIGLLIYPWRIRR
jgi:hypothetical protein